MEDNNIQIKYKGKIVILEEIINNPSKYNIETISENDHLKKVMLTFSYAKENEQYTFMEEDYEILKKSKIPKEIITQKIEEELKENFDLIIGYNSERILIFQQ